MKNIKFSLILLLFAKFLVNNCVYTYKGIDSVLFTDIETSLNQKNLKNLKENIDELLRAIKNENVLFKDHGISSFFDDSIKKLAIIKNDLETDNYNYSNINNIISEIKKA
jgi:hypothetical protein